MPPGDFISATLLPIAGLIFGFAGGMVLLGPKIRSVALTVSYLDRWQVKNLIDRLERGDVIRKGEDAGFGDMKTIAKEVATGTSLTFEPHSQKQHHAKGLLENMDEMELIEGGIEYRVSDGVQSDSIDVDVFKNHSELYTGTEQLYFQVGGLLLGVGFYFQIVSEVMLFNRTMGFILYILGALTILYVIWRMAPHISI